MRGYMSFACRRCRPAGPILFLALISLWGQPCRGQLAGSGSDGVTYTEQDIYDDGQFNAFTDLTRYDGNWYVVFRSAYSHAIPAAGQQGGQIRVLESSDAQTWTTAALLSGTGDLRDPKITVTPGNQLMITTGDVSQTSNPTVQSAAFFSSNGSTWGSENPTGVFDSWIWRTVWHNGVGYGVAYGPNGTDPTGGSEQTTWLQTTTDGLNYGSALQLTPTGQLADEAGLTFLPDGTAVMAVRRENMFPAIGVATGDYTNWTFTNANMNLFSPDLLTLPDGRIVAAGRMFVPNSTTPYTGLAWLDPASATLTPFLEFPNSVGQDTGYPGLSWYNNELWVSYYATIPDSPTGASDIFLAKSQFRACRSPEPRRCWVRGWSWGSASGGGSGCGK